jgi:hypothetical protein
MARTFAQRETEVKQSMWSLPVTGTMRVWPIGPVAPALRDARAGDHAREPLDQGEKSYS